MAFALRNNRSAAMAHGLPGSKLRMGQNVGVVALRDPRFSQFDLNGNLRIFAELKCSSLGRAIDLNRPQAVR